MFSFFRPIIELEPLLLKFFMHENIMEEGQIWTLCSQIPVL
jgi:hypothetical protein